MNSTKGEFGVGEFNRDFNFGRRIPLKSVLGGGMDASSRRLQSEQLIQTLRQGKTTFPGILCGDFNCGVDSAERTFAPLDGFFPRYVPHVALANGRGLKTHCHQPDVRGFLDQVTLCATLILPADGERS